MTVSVVAPLLVPADLLSEHPETGASSRAKLLAQHEAFCKVLADAGVRLLSPAPQPAAAYQVFARDPAFVIGDTLFVGRMKDASRQTETAGLRELRQQFVNVVSFSGMTPLIERLSSDFLPLFLGGMAVNFEIAIIALAVGLAGGLLLALARLGGGVPGGVAALVISVMRAAPTFVVMFFLLNAIPRDATLLGAPFALSGVMAVALVAAPIQAFQPAQLAALVAMVAPLVT